VIERANPNPDCHRKATPYSEVELVIANPTSSGKKPSGRRPSVSLNEKVQRSRAFSEERGADFANEMESKKHHTGETLLPTTNPKQTKTQGPPLSRSASAQFALCSNDRSSLALVPPRWSKERRASFIFPSQNILS